MSVSTRRPTNLVGSCFFGLESWCVPLSVLCRQERCLLVESAPQPPPVVQSNTWLHLGLQELRHNRFEAHKLEPRTPSYKLDTAEPCREITLVGQWEFESSWTFPRDLCKTSSWYFRFFHFSQSRRPLGKLEPINCVVKELESPLGMSRALRFWSGQGDIDRSKRLEYNRLQREHKKATEASTELTPANDT